MRYFRHTLYHRAVGGSTDAVIGHCDLPSESRLNRVQGQVHCVLATQELVTSVSLYGCDGWIIDLPDPDTADLVDDIWDRLVEKDFDESGGLDLDTSGPETAPFDEPGEFNVNRIAGTERLDQEKRWFRRRKMISFATSPSGFDPAADNYFPTDAFRVDAKRGWNSDSWAVALLGFGVPLVDDTTTTIPSTPATEARWLQNKYLEVVLEQAWMDLAGLTETGAETPWEDAVNMVEDVLEPTVVEQNAAAFESGTFNVWSQMTWDISVPGRRDFSKALTGAS